MSHDQTTVHRLFELTEPIAAVCFSERVLGEICAELGLRGMWDGYFASRAAALGTAPAEVVHAVFYSFAPGEAARHIPRVWQVTTPQKAIVARERASCARLRERIGAQAESPELSRLADLAIRAALSARIEGRPMYAGLRALDAPDEPVARLWHATTLLREHRGDGHNATLLANGVGGTEAHVLMALSLGMRAEEFDRLQHLPAAQVAGVVDGLRARGLVDANGSFTPAGRALKERIEARTDELAAPVYDALAPAELDELVTGLGPIADAIESWTEPPS